MAMKKKPVTGMKDILPREMEIRDYAIGLIKDTYKTYGFTSVETPAVEHIENLLPAQEAATPHSHGQEVHAEKDAYGDGHQKMGVRHGLPNSLIPAHA